MPVDIIIYHNPECGTSRNTLAMIRNAGIEPYVVEYLKTPPSRPMLVSLIERTGVAPHALLREKDTPFAELELSDASLGNDQLVDG
jgi:arsenate reductase